MEFENFNIEPEDDDEREEDRKQKFKKSNIISSFLSRFKPKEETEDFKLEDILGVKETPEQSVDLNDGEANTPEQSDDSSVESVNLADKTEQSPEIFTKEEEKIILQSIADIHLSDLPPEDENTGVVVFLNELSSTGDLEQSYLISTSQEEDGTLVNQLSIKQPLQNNIAIETSRTSYNFKNVDNKQPQFLEVKPTASPKKKNAFNFLTQEIKKIKLAEQPVRSSMNFHEAVSRHLEKLDNQVEVFKVRIRNESLSEKNLNNFIENVPAKSQNLNRHETIVSENNKTAEINLTDKEVILISEKIKLENISLKQIFKNREISLNGMRRVVNAYLATGNFEKILKKELILHQIDFEKDPIYKDVRSDDNIPAQYSSPKSVEQLLEEKNLILGNINSQPISLSPRENISGIEKPSQLKVSPKIQPNKINNYLNLFLVIIILMLLVILIYIIFFKV